MPEDLCFAFGEYAVLLKGGQEALEESLLEAVAHVWLEEGRIEKTNASREYAPE